MKPRIIHTTKGRSNEMVLSCCEACAWTESILHEVVIADYVTNADIETKILAGTANVTTLDVRKEEELLPRGANADVLMVWHIVPWWSATLSKLGRCKGIVRCGAGYDNVDLEAAGKNGMYVCNVPDYGVEEVADHALALSLSLIRNITQFNSNVKKRSWGWSLALRIPRMRTLTVGIVGLGRIGTAVALRMKSLGCKVVAYDPYIPDGKDKSIGVESVDFNTLLSVSDLVSIHAPLTNETRHMFNEEAFSHMKTGSIIINTARGGIIDQNALHKALLQKKIMAAGLDVLEVEPCKRDNPLLELENVIITPHAAFYSLQSLLEVRTKAALEAERILRGEKPRNLVNLQYLKGPPDA